MVKATLRWILPVCALISTLLISLFLYSLQSQAFFFTTSPRGTYTVTLTGHKERPLLPIYNHTVHLNVIKDGKPYLSNKYLHSGDWMDPSFEISYPQSAWVDNNILHFYREENYRNGTSELIVVNETNKTVKYLRVISEDMYLLFDLLPASVTRLPVAPPKGDFRWINTEGEFSDGRKIELNGANFSQFTGNIYIYINNESTIINRS